MWPGWEPVACRIVATHASHPAAALPTVWERWSRTEIVWLYLRLRHVTEHVARLRPATEQ